MTQPAIRRIVVSCPDRLGYPEQLIRQLTKQYAEIPLALAVSSWWEGAGRTGLQRPIHPVLPWHRWWDGWLPWLSGEQGDLFNCCPNLAVYMNICRSAPVRASSRRVSGLIVANCKATAAGWAALAQQCGSDVDLLTHRRFTAGPPHQSPHLQSLALPSPAMGVSWILWDDSCLDAAADSADVYVEQFLRAAGERFPAARRYVAVSIPRWDSWQHALACGAHELLVKPGSGAAFYRLLYSK